MIVMGPNASATTPYVCDPSTDTYECECPQPGLDSCTEYNHSALVEASDASDLANYVSATWTGSYWNVVVDAEGMPGGVLRLGSDAGEWDDIDDLYSFLSTVFGSTVTPDTGSGSIYLLPEMRVYQEGATHRLDDTTDDWAPANSHNLIYDAITNADGEIYLGADGPFELFGTGCPGTDANSFDSATDGTLTGEQCSHGDGLTYTQVSDDSCPNYPQDCDVIFQSGQTTLETASTTYFGDTLHCAGGGTTCNLQSGWFTAKRVEADELELDTGYFTGGSLDSTHTYSQMDVMSIVTSRTRVDGICSLGFGEDGSNQIFPETRDGSYDSRHTTCDW